MINKVTFDLVSYQDVLGRICRWKERGERQFITATNPHSVMLCHRDPKMRDATARAGLTLPDGAGVVWGGNLLGHCHNGRVTGPQLMLNLCDWGRERGLRHFIYGGKEGVADRLAANLQARFPGMEVVGTYCPPFRELSSAEDAGVVELINETRPDIVWVGLGAPKQEKWMLDHMGMIAAPAMIGVGAAFDFHAGNVEWAPAWVREAGLEWIHRLYKEPRRMWRRNLDSPLFLLGVLSQMVLSLVGRPPQPFAWDENTSGRAQASH
ncbi:WecB/TagA/CpsF family glycosyltransferase [bacterium]|nr:WecB/TagA/CpsF family glycosyltransferase [bacterium]